MWQAIETFRKLLSHDKDSSIGSDDVINTDTEVAQLINSFFSNILT